MESLKTNNYSYTTLFSTDNVVFLCSQFKNYTKKRDKYNMDNVLDTKIQIKLTLSELEDITLALRIVNKVFSGDSRSELEDRLSNIVTTIKMSV